MRWSADLNSRALKRGVGEMKIFQWDKINEKMPRAVAAWISNRIKSGNNSQAGTKRGVSDRI